MIKHTFSRRRPTRPLGEDLRRPVVREEIREEIREEERQVPSWPWDADGREVEA